MTDARFEDADVGPLRLAASDADNLSVISALVQDAVFPITEMTFARARRRFALLLNRLRREDQTGAEPRRPVERVQSLLVFDEVLAVQSSGIDRSQLDTVLALLSVTFEPVGEDGAGRVILTLAGDGAVALTVEALDIHMRDVTRPYRAPSGKVPDHGL